MTRKFIILLIVALAALVGIAGWLGMRFAGTAGERSPYSAVVFTTGDVYFGRLSWFPRPVLREVWFLQRGVDAENQPQFGIAPFRGAFWGPTDEIRFNPREVVFWTRLR
ncbi:MAG: hypothetical protein HY436_00590, partial [Candidatus Liptonbacteria bacterium]|nr:hypothetical protein [Candidatus Liptonbacteria bacterium]